MHGGSHSSGSSASSMSSTFSDLGSSTSASSSSPPVSKTNAFFASPFSTRPPSPVPPPPPPPQTKPRSLTADFFAASVKPPSPPPSGKSFSSSAIHPSRIFPSRYTSTHGSSSARSPDFSLLNPELSMSDHARDRSSESESSIPSQTSFGRPRLPTPPQIPTRPRMHRDDTIMPIKPDDEQLYTPRPADFEPPILLRFERSLLLKKQKSLADVAANPPSPPPQPEADLSDGEEEEEPHPGSIISLSSPDLPPTTPGGSRYQYQSSQISPLALSFTIAAPSPIPASFRTAAAAAANGDRGTPTPKNPNGPTQTNGDSTNVPTAGMSCVFFRNLFYFQPVFFQCYLTVITRPCPHRRRLLQTRTARALLLVGWRRKKTRIMEHPSSVSCARWATEHFRLSGSRRI